MSKERKAIGYVRVSTGGQAQDGVSLEAQEERIRAWCLSQGYQLDEIFVDAGISGFKMRNRPGLQDAIAAACRNGAALVVYSLSRLARSTRDALDISERLAKSGADFASLSERLDTTSAAGKMLYRLLAVFAEFERDLISERTRMALSHVRSQGRKTGGDVPFGYEVDGNGNLIENSAELTTIELIFSLRRDELSLRKIATELEQRGIRTKSGGMKWSAKVIRSILKREVAQEMG